MRTIIQEFPRVVFSGFTIDSDGQIAITGDILPDEIDDAFLPKA